MPFFRSGIYKEEKEPVTESIESYLCYVEEDNQSLTTIYQRALYYYNFNSSYQPLNNVGFVNVTIGETCYDCSNMFVNAEARFNIVRIGNNVENCSWMFAKNNYNKLKASSFNLPNRLVLGNKIKNMYGMYYSQWDYPYDNTTRGKSGYVNNWVIPASVESVEQLFGKRFNVTGYMYFRGVPNNVQLGIDNNSTQLLNIYGSDNLVNKFLEQYSNYTIQQIDNGYQIQNTCNVYNNYVY